MMTKAQMAELSAKTTGHYRVTPEVYAAFQHCSGDYNPLHTDAEFARRKGFAQPVMYGNILNAFVSHFVGMLLPTQEVMIQAQDMSWHRPVFMGDDILMEATVESVSEAVNAIVYKIRFYREEQEKRQLVARGHVQIGLLE